MAASFVFLLLIGVQASSFLAAGISVACGLGAVALSRQRMTTPTAKRKSQKPPESQTKSPVKPDLAPPDEPSNAAWLLIAAGLGLATIGLEVCYTRLFALVFQNSVYTFGIVVAVFLAGLSLGAAVSSLLLSRFRAATIVWCGCLAGASVAAISGVVFLHTTNLEYFGGGGSFFSYVGCALAIVALTVLPPVIVLGILLPACWQASPSWHARPAATVGWLTATNTMGATGGALAASFLLLPIFGPWGAITVLASALAILGACVGWRSGRRLEAAGALLAALAVIVVAHQDDRRLAVPVGGELVERWNSAYGWIDIIRRPFDGVMLLRQDIHYGLGSDLDVAWERRQGHLPLLLHPAPQDVAFLGLGTGITASAAVAHPEIEKIEIAELIPEVIEASRRYYGRSTGTLYRDPRVRLHRDDARHFLLTTDQKFDVIISDLFTPYHSQTGYLYTVEHYRAARQRLMWKAVRKWATLAAC